jgi:hypothetical protein
MEKDLEHLKLLGIFHYIWGGLSLLGGLAIGAYFLFIGIVLMANPSATSSSTDENVNTGVVGGVMIGVGVSPFYYCSYLRRPHPDGGWEISEASRWILVLFHLGDRHVGHWRYPRDRTGNLFVDRSKPCIREGDL